jgi:20S proteasome alpha/beta subunit
MDVSLILAVKGRDGVVLCADTRVTRKTLDRMNYKEDGISKVRFFGQGCSVGVTGDLGFALPFIENASSDLHFSKDKAIEDTLEGIRESLKKHYKQCYGNEAFDGTNPQDTNLVFAGHGSFGGKFKSFVYSMSPSERFSPRDAGNISSIGQHAHGGLYFALRYQRPDMDVKRAAFLGYFCINEVASLDGAVGPPVEITVCRDNSSSFVSADWLTEFRLRYTNAHHQMREWFALS